MPAPTPNLRRRDFLATAAGVGLGGGWVRRVLANPTGLTSVDGEAVRFGVIADPHHGLQPDAQRRLDAFIDDCLKHDDLDFIIQLGDFCHPEDAAKPFVESFNRFAGPRNHVLGNHDMDKGSKDDVLRLWGAEQRFYSFDAGPYHFVVLDCNNLRDGETYTHYDDSNYYVEPEKRAWTDPEQRAWLADDLQNADRPTIVFSHQPIGIYDPDRDAPPPQQEQVLKLLRMANADRKKVLACLCGHMHVDRAEQHAGMHCVCINSASYLWTGGRQEYRDPLYAFVTCSDDGTIVIDGRVSEFSGKHPHEQGLAVGVPGVSASISDRELRPQ